MDHFLRLVKTISTAWTTATAVAAAFVDRQISKFAIPKKVLMENESQLISKIFRTVCAELRIMPMTTKEYHTQTICPVERYNAKTACSLFRHVAEHQKDLDSYVTPLGYAYNARVHLSSKPAPLSHVLSRHPLGSASLKSTTLPPNVNDI